MGVLACGYESVMVECGEAKEYVWQRCELTGRSLLTNFRSQLSFNSIYT